MPVGVAIGSEATVTDSRPPGAVSLSWEVTSKVLGSRQEASDLMGMFTDTSTNSASAEFLDPFPRNKFPVWGSRSMSGQARPAPPLRGFGAERNPPTLGLKSVIKGLETLPTTPLEKIRLSSAPSVCLTELQQKRTCLRIPAQSRNS
jgi:hypothetical protein